MLMLEHTQVQSYYGSLWILLLGLNRGRGAFYRTYTFHRIYTSTSTSINQSKRQRLICLSIYDIFNQNSRFRPCHFASLCCHIRHIELSPSKLHRLNLPCSTTIVYYYIYYIIPPIIRPSHSFLLNSTPPPHQRTFRFFFLETWL